MKILNSANHFPQKNNKSSQLAKQIRLMIVSTGRKLILYYFILFYERVFTMIRNWWSGLKYEIIQYYWYSVTLQIVVHQLILKYVDLSPTNSNFK